MKVKCDHTDLQNVGFFKYLGSIFAADGEQRHDVSRRIAIALSRFGELRQIFNSDDLDQQLKIKIYKAAIASQLADIRL